MEKIRFKSDTHQYFHGERELISVSALTKKFEEHKDWGAIATRYAKKNGETKEYWQNKWKEKGVISTERGTLVHEIKEKELLAQDKVEYLDVSCSILPCETIDGIKYSIPILDLPFNTIFPELMIYDLDYGICGQSDKVITTNTHIHVEDYKTDKEILFKGFSSQWKKPEKFAEPLQHLDNCNGMKYAIKMSLYMYMLWKQNKHLKPGKLILEHIILERDEDGIPLLSKEGIPIILDEKRIEVPYLKKEVIDLLNYYKNEIPT